MRHPQDRMLLKLLNYMTTKCLGHTGKKENKTMQGNTISGKNMCYICGQQVGENSQQVASQMGRMLCCIHSSASHLSPGDIPKNRKCLAIKKFNNFIFNLKISEDCTHHNDWNHHCNTYRFLTCSSCYTLKILPGATTSFR